jgi:hypothetical protein
VKEAQSAVEMSHGASVRRDAGKRWEAREKHAVSQPTANAGARGTGCGTVNSPMVAKIKMTPASR